MVETAARRQRGTAWRAARPRRPVLPLPQAAPGVSSSGITRMPRNRAYWTTCGGRRKEEVGRSGGSRAAGGAHRALCPPPAPHPSEPQPHAPRGCRRWCTPPLEQTRRAPPARAAPRSPCGGRARGGGAAEVRSPADRRPSDAFRAPRQPTQNTAGRGRPLPRCRRCCCCSACCHAAGSQRGGAMGASERRGAPGEGLVVGEVPVQAVHLDLQGHTAGGAEVCTERGVEGTPAWAKGRAAAAR